MVMIATTINSESDVHSGLDPGEHAIEGVSGSTKTEGQVKFSEDDIEIERATRTRTPKRTGMRK